MKSLIDTSFGESNGMVQPEMQNFEHNLKAESHTSLDRLPEPKHVLGTSGKTSADEYDSHICNEHEASISYSRIPPEDSNGDNIGDELTHNQNTFKAGRIDNSIMARFKILKHRQEKPDLSGADWCQELNTSGSNEGRKKVRGLQELSFNLTHVDAIDKGTPQPYNLSKFTGGSPKMESTPDEKLPALDQIKGIGLYLNEMLSAGAREPHPSAAGGSSIRSYNPKSLRSWQFLSDSDSPTEWVHVLKDEFIW